MKNPLRLLLTLGFIGVLTYGIHLFSQSQEVAKETTVSGKKVSLPSELLDTDGNEVLLDEIKGKYIGLYFSASWCGPCRAEHPNLAQLSKDGLPVVGLNYKDTPSNALRFLQELGNPYEGVSSIDGRQSIEWGVFGVPETFLLDGNGKILYRATGPITQRVIREKLIPVMNRYNK